MSGRARACSSTHPTECRLRIVLIGNSGVGKSSFLTKFVENSFDTTMTKTIGIDFKTKTLKIDGKVVKLHVWDTAGQERFWSVTPAYCRNANGVILMYDITDTQSFKDISSWVDRVSEYAPSDADLLLLGSKLDHADQRVIRQDMGKEQARKIKAIFSEVSAATGENVEIAVIAFVRSILKRTGFLDIETPNSSSSTTSTSPPAPSNSNDVITVGEERRSLRSTCCYQSTLTSASKQ
jgi:small GTP-binding protein